MKKNGKKNKKRSEDDDDNFDDYIDPEDHEFKGKKRLNKGIVEDEEEKEREQTPTHHFDEMEYGDN
jgi:hypothetical protein